MKKLRSLLMVGVVGWLIVSVPLALAAGETGTFTGLGPYSQIRGTLDGSTATYTGGTMKFQITGGALVASFCTDLRHHVRSGDTFITSDEVMACEIRWLLLHYPPRLSGYTPWPDRPDALSNIGQEMAARQAAVWHFSDGFDPDASTTVGARAWQIINAVPQDPCTADQPALSITPASAVNPVNATQLFTVTVTRGGEPVSGQEVTLEANLGAPVPSTVTTDENGQATFTLTYDTPDVTSNITATAQMLLPVGTVFVGTEANKQKLVLGQQTLGPVQAYAIASWTGTGSVSSLSFDDYNMNGAYDAGEPLLEGWTVRLYRQVGLSWVLHATRTTDGSGTARFTGLSAGTYRIEQALLSGWYATTPLDVEFTLGANESRSFHFGQIKLPVIVGHVFQDSDRDGSPDAGEPPLSGWELQLYREDGSIVVGMQGTTGEDGTVVFSSHPDRNPPDIQPGGYFVQEVLQQGWYATTGISQAVTVGSGGIGHAWLGNIHPAPSLALDKSGPAMAHEGDNLTFLYTVTNTGNVPLDGVAVSDPQLGGQVCLLGTLEPGETRNCEATYRVPAGLADVVESTASASGTEPYLGGEAHAEDTHTLAILRPGLELSATGPAMAHEGDTVAYQLTLHNTGNTPLQVALPLPDGGLWEGTIPAGGVVHLSPTAVVPTNGDPFVAAFTAAGTDALGAEVTDDAAVSTDVLHPALRLSLTPSVGEVRAGDAVVLTFVATNIGDTSLYNVSIAFDNGTPTDPADDYTLCILAELEPGESFSCDETVVPEESTTYAASATGRDGLGRTAGDEDEETVSVVPDDSDADGDGTPDYLDSDSDNDNIPDLVEGTGDADGDGTPNYLDSDSDGDTIPDAVEGADDADGDGTPNFLDLDSDGDMIPDAVEGADDADGDGTPNFLDLDSDGDTIPDAVEGAGDADGDGTPNFLDSDSDGDGILDRVEWNTDANGDGAVDERDRDADGDGTPNYLDLDSDGDGKPDAEEGTCDSDGDGIPDFLDPDDEGGTTAYTYRIFLPVILANRN